ncbi:hypothetical protein T07_4970 [Trichinella nelsoni]|uniref:Uncharacterized protein n=1 Tax=Trichinella nelsoni TaxID=6336 RepID=A0A0V0RS65_9BILA|nr:hypothetical protein T07_4970 [Trichinella nelsoni]
MNSLTNVRAIVLAVMSRMGYASGHFEKQSWTVKMYLFPRSVRWNGYMMSTPIRLIGYGAVCGCSCP